MWPERGEDLLLRLDQRTQKFLEKHATDDGTAALRAGTPKSFTSRPATKSFSGVAAKAPSKAAAPANEASASPRMLGSPKKPPSPSKASPPRPPPAASGGGGSSGSLDMDVPPMGARVVADVREGTYTGTVRFTGETAFAAGVWVGIELDEARGKNDGSVGGNRYFACPKNFGLFVRANQLTVDEDSPPAPPPKASGGGSGFFSSMFGGSGATPKAAGGGPAGADASLEDWQAMGVDLLHEHKKHIDAVLSQLREEMELLADFERLQDKLTKERVVTYNEAMRVCVEHRDELSADFKTSVQQCYDKYGVSHDNLSIE